MRFIVSRSRTRLSVRKFLFLCTLFFFTTLALLLLLNLNSSIDSPTTAFSLPPKALPESLHPLDPLKPNPSSPIRRRSPVQSSCATVEEMGEDASSEVATRKESLRVRRIIRYHFEFHAVIMPHQPRTKGKSASRNHEDIQVNRRSSSTTDELVQLLRQQASQRQPHSGLGIASVDLGYPYSLPARKRPVSLLGDDPLYSDPRGYPRARFESSFTAASPSVLSQRVGATSLPYYRQQGSGHASGSLHGVEDYPNSFQTRGAPYHGNSGKYNRY